MLASFLLPLLLLSSPLFFSFHPSSFISLPFILSSLFSILSVSVFSSASSTPSHFSPFTVFLLSESLLRDFASIDSKMISMAYVNNYAYHFHLAFFYKIRHLQWIQLPSPASLTTAG